MARTHPPYPAEFRQQMVELVHAGRAPVELAREFDCSAQAIRNWVAQDSIDQGKPLPGKEGGLTSAEREELARLRLDASGLQIIPSGGADDFLDYLEGSSCIHTRIGFEPWGSTSSWANESP